MFQNIHAFVGSVALAGAEDGLWSIEGGNRKLVEKLLEASKAAFLEAKVQSLYLKFFRHMFVLQTYDGKT